MKYFVRGPTPVRPCGREAMKHHDKQLLSHRTGIFLDILSHSLLGLVDIYNILPKFVVDASTVSEFQKRLQLLVMEVASTDTPGWMELYSPRNTIWNNKLRQMSEWTCKTRATEGNAVELMTVRTNGLPAWLQ